MNDAQLQVLADRLATDVLAVQLRPNRLTRYGETRSGALAMAAFLAGTVVATGGVYRRVVNIDPLAVERLYAKTVAVDRDRAHADVYYVDQRLRLLTIALNDDPEDLIRAAAQALVAFVAAGRPAELRLDEVEHAYVPLREATDDKHPTGTITGLHAAYLDAWLRALS